MLTNLLNSVYKFDEFGSLKYWDTGGSPTVGSNGLDESVAAGEYKWARSTWYLTGDFEIQAKVTIQDRTAGASHWTSMWISRQSDDQCFAANRNTWKSTSGWSPQWRGWDSCSSITSMGVVGTTTTADIAIVRILREGVRVRTYIKHNEQGTWPNSSWILTGDDTSFFSGVSGDADANVTLASQSRAADNPTATVYWEYIDIISGTVVYT